MVTQTARGRARRQEGRAVACGPLARPVQDATDASAEGDDEDQRRERADADPDPLLLGQAGRLELIEVLRELVKILRRELRQLLVHLLLREAGRRALSPPARWPDVAHQRQVSRALIEALVRRGLRRNRSCERRDRCEGEDEYEDEQHRETLGHHLLPPCYSWTAFCRPRPKRVGEQDECRVARFRLHAPTRADVEHLRARFFAVEEFQQLGEAVHGVVAADPDARGAARDDVEGVADRQRLDSKGRERGWPAG